jgi:hypothetical protein
MVWCCDADSSQTLRTYQIYLKPNFHSPGLIPSENPRFSASFACADEIVVLNAQEFRR